MFQIISGCLVFNWLFSSESHIIPSTCQLRIRYSNSMIRYRPTKSTFESICFAMEMFGWKVQVCHCLWQLCTHWTHKKPCTWSRWTPPSPSGSCPAARSSLWGTCPQYPPLAYILPAIYIWYSRKAWNHLSGIVWIKLWAQQMRLQYYLLWQGQESLQTKLSLFELEKAKLC